MRTREAGSGRGRGRPRSEQARQAILEAAGQLLSETGYGRLTMEGIARRAGVSKQTIYRWWPTRSAVVQEALTEGAAALAPAPDLGSLEADLRALVGATARGMGGAYADMLTGLMAEAQLDDDFAERFRAGFLAQRRAVLREVIERAGARGEIAAHTDIDLLTDLVFGTLWYRLLARHAPVDGQLADRLTDLVLRLCRTHANPKPDDPS
jgi:AcrR family transcriptional regulator